jgi:hypothetical protein
MLYYKCAQIGIDYGITGTELHPIPSLRPTAFVFDKLEMDCK